jgi:hypothetical protein
MLNELQPLTCRFGCPAIAKPKMCGGFGTTEYIENGDTVRIFRNILVKVSSAMMLFIDF